MTKKRPDPSSSATPAMQSPFAKLQGLRDALPPGEPPAKEEDAKKQPSLGEKLVVRKERAGRGGKTVTVVEGIALRGEALEELARRMKKALGCGAAIEDGALVLQGELEERARDQLLKLGAKNVVLGTKKKS